ncbi:MAG: 50S ribosomal protein L18 [Nitrospirae bacterium]|nr:MAG: 50S ribosomal protein L18 [Nitrospirota bacterium]
MNIKETSRQKRHARIRKKVLGTSERPRLCVYKSLNNIYAQIIDDIKGTTLISASTLDKEMKIGEGHKGNADNAKKTGQLLAVKASKAGIKRVVFDRGGYRYHGRIKALADGAREGGLEF